MSNSRIMLVCKHCGEGFCIGKGYLGSYVTVNEAMFEQLNDFFKKHAYGCCSNDTDCSDNARNHFAILEEGEDLDVLTADVAPRAEFDRVARELERVENLYFAKDTQLENAKAEIARLKKIGDDKMSEILRHATAIGELHKQLATARSEAIKEFAERLKSDLGRIPQHRFTRSQVEWSINTFVKEMTEELK